MRERVIYIYIVYLKYIMFHEAVLDQNIKRIVSLILGALRLEDQMRPLPTKATKSATNMNDTKNTCCDTKNTC